MKKVYGLLLIAAALFIGCQNETENLPEQQVIDMSDFYVHSDGTDKSPTEGKQCHSMEVLNRMLEKDPELFQRMYDIEYATRKFITGKPGNGNGNGNGNGGGGNGGDGGDGGTGGDNLGVVNIPVYVHVVYSNTMKTSAVLKSILK